ncbi:MAG: LytTR family DNA-binding domain-containing protein, partial [Cyclobacteriaceae bacterium]
SFNYDCVVDYLNKPVKLARMVRSVERLRKILQLEQSVSAGSPVAAERSTLPADFVCIKDGKTLYKIAYDELVYLQSYGNYVKYFLADGDIKIARNTISQAQEELPTGKFCRIHKSYMVNLDRIRQVEGNQVKLADSVLPIGKHYKALLTEVLSGRL